MKSISDREKAVLQKIEQDPYFALQLRPEAPNIKLTHDEARKIVATTKVSLRGWDFPHFLRDEIRNANSYVFNLVDWERHLEIWRLYFSGQFVYFGNLWDVLPHYQESLRKEFEHSDPDLPRGRDLESIKGLTSFIGLIYSVTEFYVFAARLSAALKLSGNIDVKNSLKNVEGWVLGCGDPGIPWYSFYQCEIPSIDISRTLSIAKLLANPTDEAVLAIQRLFVGFNWNDASGNMIRQWQAKLMAGKSAL